MKRYIQKIQLLLTVLALGTLASCSSEEELTGNTTTTLAAGQIEVDSFPAFSENTGSRAIGTPDAGKTAWANGDKILLKAEVFDGFENSACTGTAESTTTYTLTYDGTAGTWAADKTITLSATSYQNGVKFTALYAPNYEWNTNALVLKTGKAAGTDEYLTTTSDYAYSALSSTTPSISFSAASRNYSRLRVATDPGMKVTLTTASFTANGETTAIESGIAATADDKGNAYFYGTWTADASAKLETDAVRTYGTIENKRITLPTAETAKSYAVAGPKWVIDHSCYYYWDASSSIVDGEYDNKELLASNSCKDCPTARQLVKYLNKGYYYDDGTIETEGWQTYTVLTGQSKTPTDFHTGLWLPKKSTIDGFDDETTGDPTILIKSIADEHKITAANAAEIRTKGNYFFLPATGYGNSLQNGSSVSFAGTSGQYWSKTSEEFYGDHVAYDLYFNSERIFVTADYLGGYAYVPMVIE